MKASDAVAALGATLKGVVKIAMKSRRTVDDPSPAPDRVVILANGPSLRRELDENASKLAASTTMCVNFMANAPEFSQIRPRYYVLADPHFFRGTDHDNVFQLWQNLGAVEWPMTLFVPANEIKRARKLIGKHARLTLATFNCVGVEGFGWFERRVYRSGLAMPRPRNVLIPSIMLAINLGAREIYLLGADHSWMQTLRVDDDNNVVSMQPHFYKDTKAESERTVTEYKGYRLHDIIMSFYVAFSGYHRLRRYAESRGTHIYNATPDSMIDAFERRRP